MKKIVSVFTILIMINLIIYVPVIGSAQTNPASYYPTPYANIEETNATIIINTTFYELIINKHFNEPGALMIKKGSATGTLINPTTAPAIIVLIQEDGRVERVNWTKYSVYNISDTLILANFVGKGLNSQVNLTLYFDGYKPYINVKISVTNPSAKVYFVLPVDSGHAKKWSQAVSEYDTYSLRILLKNVPDYSVYQGIDAIALIGYAENSTMPSLLIGYTEIYKTQEGPVEAGILNLTTLPSNPLKDLENMTGLLFTISFNHDYTYNFDLAALHYDPYEILVSNLDAIVAKVYPQAVSDFKNVIYNQEILNQLNQTIQSLKTRVDDLAKENQNITKKLKEYEGCEAYWKNEVNVRDQQIARLRDRIRQEGTIAVTVFFVGLVLGGIGGYYVIGLEKKAKGVRKRR